MQCDSYPYSKKANWVRRNNNALWGWPVESRLPESVPVLEGESYNPKMQTTTQTNVISI